MSWLNIILVVVLAVLVLRFGYSKMRLVEHHTNGGRKKKRVRGKGNNNIEKLECIVTKKQAEEIMDEINDKFGDSQFLVNTKVDIIMDKFKGKKVGTNEILESVNIYKKGVEKVYIEEKKDEIYSDLYKCPRCGVRKHTVREILKRQSDEPTNVICNCLNCGQKFDMN